MLYCHMCSCPAVPYFSTLPHKRDDFRVKKLLNIKSVFWVPVQRLSDTFTFLSRIQQILQYMYIGRNVKCPLFLSEFNESWIFLDRFSIDSQVPNFMKIRTIGAELFRAGGRAGGRKEDMPKLIVAFWNSAYAPTKVGVPCYFQNTENFSKVELKKKE